MAESDEEMQSFDATPTWSVAIVLTMFVTVSLLVERSIHRLGHWLHRTNRKPLVEAVEKMKEELMLLGFISLLLTATSGLIANMCVPSKYYANTFIPCTKSEISEGNEGNTSKERKLLSAVLHLSDGRALEELKISTCKEGHEPFLSYEGLEQLHRFIFVMAVTHVFYSCLTMVLAIMKIHSWRKWEEEAHRHHHSLPEISVDPVQRQSTFVKFYSPSPFVKNDFLIWVTCFFRQFGRSVGRADYLTLRQGFIVKHKLSSSYDFHGCMIRSMEEEFQKIVGVSVPLWAFIVAIILFNVKGSHLYFWVAIIPVALVIVVGTKLQYIIASLVLENASISSFFSGARLAPRDDLFWFKKPELLLSLIHFILFQNAFEMASFVWFWWQFGFNSCFIGNHYLVSLRLIIGFAGQFLCSYSTLPLYALVTQMGTNYKAATVPRKIRDAMHGWGRAARKKQKYGVNEASVVVSIEEDHRFVEDTSMFTEIELQTATLNSPVSTDVTPRDGTPLLKPSGSVSAEPGSSRKA